jgi:hypothetical protein
MVSSGVTFDPHAALTRRTIHGKSVVSFESHHYALLPWSEWRQELDAAPRLLSIDYHTDKHEPFLRWTFEEWTRRTGEQFGMPPDGERAVLRSKRLSEVSPSDPASVAAAVLDLCHDEHIKTALQADVVDLAFLISHQDQDRLLSDQQLALDREWEKQDQILQLMRIAEKPSAQPPFTYTLPASRLVILKDDTSQPDEAAYRQWRDEVIDGPFLQGRLDLIGEICRTAGLDPLFSRPFILDIDLDAFNTQQAIAPHDPGVFYDLIRRAYAVTIAQEPGCVETCQIEGERLTASWLEEELIGHIERALS